VPILENAFEVNLPKLMRVVKATGDSRVVLDDSDVKTVAVLAETRLAVFLGGRACVADIVAVQCLQGRVRPLLKCPRAHEGNFQSLYFLGDELACRHCHALRYRTTTVTGSVQRAGLKREKALIELGGGPGEAFPLRGPGRWRRRYVMKVRHYETLCASHYDALQIPSQKQ